MSHISYLKGTIGYAGYVASRGILPATPIHPHPTTPQPPNFGQKIGHFRLDLLSGVMKMQVICQYDVLKNAENYLMIDIMCQRVEKRGLSEFNLSVSALNI